MSKLEELKQWVKEERAHFMYPSKAYYEGRIYALDRVIDKINSIQPPAGVEGYFEGGTVCVFYPDSKLFITGQGYVDYEDALTALQQLSEDKEAVIIGKAVETIYSHYKKTGGYTRTAAMLIEKLTGKKWERDKELAELQAENERRKREIDSEAERVKKEATDKS